MKREGTLKLLLLIFCIVNVILGVVAFSSNEALILKTASLVYGIKLSALEPHTLYTVRMLGCFVLAIGVMSGFAAKDPIKNKAVIYGNIVWLVMRSIQRVIELKPAHDAFGTSYPMLWLGTIFVFSVAVVLYVLMPKGEEA